eukprot:9502322-Pyramimonas_sp.AAC.1
MKEQKKHDHQGEDHAPVTATATWTIKHAAPKQLFPNIDRNQLKSQEAIGKFKNELNSTALPAWAMNYDEH